MKLSKIYEPKEYESTIYGLWETSGSFKPSGVGEPFSITLPPPNANGNLHLGHGLINSLQDILVRYHRMQGRDTIYIPGSDHAGFETWVVYERELNKQGKSRFDFSREDLYGRVWDFVEKHRGNMELQLRQLGASVDWDAMVFTLDKKVVDRAYKTFERMWHDDLIYRGERMVNYCTLHRTSFADIEVEYKIEQSKLWQIAYPVVDKVGEIVVATTRPETMFGDTAIAVHPEDERYKSFIGSKVVIPTLHREIPVIADTSVDREFGTGAVKITPAHDPNDYEMGQRHKLPLIQVINEDGTMNENAPEGLQGLPVLEARTKLIAMLKADESLKSEVEYEHSVGHCYKCGTLIQPLVKDQWFVRVEPLAKRAIEAIERGDITFYPSSKGKLAVQYFKNLKDWNISRQIPWGIPIPAFQNIHDHNDWIFDTRVDQEKIEVDGKTYRREEDTFDTWFSSGQWPYVTTDYPEGSDLSRFYPNSVMETGYDILFAWVTRMIMFGLYITDKVPFKDVYLNGLVLDEKGKKMSKSKGNVISPIEVADKYGSDAFRMGVIAGRSAGLSQAFDYSKIIAGRNFANKLWNMARFIEGKVGDDSIVAEAEVRSIADAWVVRQLNDANKSISSHLEQYRFAEAYDMLYHTIWDDVADWYLESSKQEPNKPMLLWVLETTLKLAHPFAPFVSEAIWQTLRLQDSNLITTKWPETIETDLIGAGEFDRLKMIVGETRFVAAELAPHKPSLIYREDALIDDNQQLFKTLTGLTSVETSEQPHGLRLAVPNHELWLSMSAEALYEHQSKLERRLVEVRNDVSRLQGRMQNENYINQAPAKLVEETRQQLNDQLELEKRLIAELEILEA